MPVTPRPNRADGTLALLLFLESWIFWTLESKSLPPKCSYVDPMLDLGNPEQALEIQFWESDNKAQYIISAYPWHRAKLSSILSIDNDIEDFMLLANVTTCFTW